MINGKVIGKMLGSIIFVAALLSFTQCASKSAPVADLPKDILGVGIGMDKADVQKRMEEIAQFQSEGRKTGQVWRLNNDPHFDNLVVGYSRENKVRFVTGLVDAATTKQRMRFSSVGDLAKAEKEVTEPHHRYTWKFESADGIPAYFITIYGDNPEFLSIYSIALLADSEEKK